MTKKAISDVLVLGAGPAGAAAALFAARQGLQVTIVDRGAAAHASPCPEWLHPDANKLFERAGIKIGPALGRIERVRFTDSASRRQAPTRIDGHLSVVDSTALTAQMLRAALAAGAELSLGLGVTGIDTEEQAVILRTSTGDRRSGRFLIAADGYESLSVHSFGLDRPRAGRHGSVCCQVIAKQAYPQAKIKEDTAQELTWMLTSEDLSDFGYAYWIGRDLVIGQVMHTRPSAPADELRNAFLQTVAGWQSAEIIPPRLPLDPAAVEIRPLPRGLALEMETHVAKHSLIIGDAGGFVVASSPEGLYPSLLSAMLAVEVCAKALKSEFPQDILSEFDARWRQDLVEYLRLPNADLRFLLPLVFTNERIARRLANWLLCARAT